MEGALPVGKSLQFCMGRGSSRQLPGFNLGLGIFPSRTNVHVVIMCISFPVAVTVEVTVKAYYCPTGPFFQALNLCGVVLYSRVKKQRVDYFTASERWTGAV